MTDEELFMAYIKGDEHAFDTLYRRRKRQFMGWIAIRVRDRSVTEDIFHQAWLTMIKNRRRYEPRAKFTTYAARIIHSRILDHVSGLSPKPNVDIEDESVLELQTRDPNPEDMVLKAEDQAHFDACLEGVPAKQVDVLILKVRWEMSWQEISDVISAPFETAKNRYRLAVDKLRKCLGEKAADV